MSALTLSGVVRGLPQVGLGTRIPSMTGSNRVRSAHCRGVTTSDSTRQRPSALGWISVQPAW
ncbi:hypothetical protein [Kitasatospora sp. CB02891]|uniref:hypothetical protein n=1 Tax=Kitasatospora sp. CB02891 TaxID=2020329 RepID=UPI000C27BCBF|nr:hypothetical protein CG736_03470 [Kitasatospora sp. CB02891]